MAGTPESLDGDGSLFDSAQPFKGVVVCCTSVPTELRADIAAKTTELGGQHKYDLTPDCTHLIVGDYDTPKYRHVAKERPDVRVMVAGWVEAVRNLWVQDVEIDFFALEKQWQMRTFETGGGEPTDDGSEPLRRRLLCCMTGFEDPEERQRIIDSIEANGGLYTGDLTKRVTHLIVHRPEGRKYQAAKNWGVVTVSVEWVADSVERGLILDEKLYDPVLPPAQRGLGAWNKQRSRVSSLGKRLRENNAAQEEGKRKLRKTASMKLNSQRDNLWGDILGKPTTTEPAPTVVTEQVPTKPAASTTAQATQPTQHTQPTQPSGARSADTQGSKLSSFGVADDSGVFASCCFHVHGFSAQKTQILVNTIASLGGLICHSLDEVVSTSGAQLAHRFLIVPQTSAPDTHPQLPDNVHIITEFYVERCMHKKYSYDPIQHVIGRPFPSFPIPGFEALSICTAGFTGVDLNQADKSIRQLGAKYEERFTANVSLLLCASLSAVRRQKLELALAWRVPVVDAEWLWHCIKTGTLVSIKPFLFAELKQNLDGPKVPSQIREKGKEKGKDSAKSERKQQPTRDSFHQGLLPKPATKQKQRREPMVDESAFVTAKEQVDAPAPRQKGPPAAEHDSNVTTTTHFETAATHFFPTDDNDHTVSFGMKSHTSAAAPLSEASFNALNKSPTAARRLLSRVTSEVADSDATDGDLGQPDDIPTQQHQENEDEENDAGTQKQKSKTPPLNAAEADKKREDEEQAKKAAAAAAAAAERLAISTKLVTSLLDSSLTAATTTGPASAPAAADGTTTAAAVSVPITTDASAGAAEDSTRGPQPRRRKRNIFGRAISNVSAASSTSNGGDGAAGGGARSESVAAVAAGGAAAAAVSCVADAPPAATQLEYEDPEARRYKEQLMSRMMGGGSGSGSAAAGGKGNGGGGGSFARKSEERLTIAQMGGYDAVRYDARAGGERRTTRRRG